MKEMKMNLLYFYKSTFIINRVVPIINKTSYN